MKEKTFPSDNLVIGSFLGNKRILARENWVLLGKLCVCLWYSFLCPLLISINSINQSGESDDGSRHWKRQICDIE